MPADSPRPHSLPVILVSLFLLTVRKAVLTFFAAMINAEGTVVYSPIMLFQGAPRSHYLTDHPLALLVADFLAAPPGHLLSLVVIVIVAWFGVRAIQTRTTRRSKLMLTAIGFELVVLAANVLFSAAAAYHHVGWGMPCNHEFVGSLVIANMYAVFLALPWVIVGAVISAVAAALGWVTRPRASS